mmetsp:Transcript_11788/g.31800  ORF Transcript_11788/g.31800 Transcript_11788/m.31800 type:complete len:258 (+) Transcript_11788:2230-3003(+)
MATRARSSCASRPMSRRAATASRSYPARTTRSSRGTSRATCMAAASKRSTRTSQSTTPALALAAARCTCPPVPWPRSQAATSCARRRRTASAVPSPSSHRSSGTGRRRARLTAAPSPTPAAGSTARCCSTRWARSRSPTRMLTAPRCSSTTRRRPCSTRVAPRPSFPAAVLASMACAQQWITVTFTRARIMMTVSLRAFLVRPASTASPGAVSTRTAAFYAPVVSFRMSKGRQRPRGLAATSAKHAGQDLTPQTRRT